MYRTVLTLLCMCRYGYLVSGQQFSQKVLMVLTTNTSINMVDVWNITGGINHSQGKESLPFNTLISEGTYRSPTVDNWDIDPPTQVILEVTNKDGTALWWTSFDINSMNSSLYSWMTMANVMDSSADITDPIYDPGFKFRDGEFCDFEIEQAYWCWICFHRITSGLTYASEFFISPQKPLSKAGLGTTPSYGDTLFFEQFNNVKGDIKFILHDKDEGICIEEFSGCAYSSTQQNYPSNTFTIKHSLERCSSNSAVYIQKSGQPKLFTTPDECPSFVPLPTLVVRCLEVTVKNAEAGVRFTFKAKGFKYFVKGEAAVITGFWLEENTTSSSPNSTEDNSLTTSGIGTSAETTMHYNSTPDLEEIVRVGPCVCKCKGTGNYITEAELALKIHLQKTKIKLQRTNLTTYTRKLTSATDTRASAQGLGYMGALVIATVVFILVSFDVLNYLQSRSYISRTK